MNQSSRAATENLFFSRQQTIVVLSQERDGMHWQKIGLPQGRKTASLKFGLLDEFFSFSPMGVGLVFTKKKQKLSHAQRVPITRRRLP